MLSLQNVTRIYSSGTGEVRALDGVSLDLDSGSFATITGPSGCGKSTLLNLLGGLDHPTSGEIHVAGIPLHNGGEAELTHYRRHTLGIVFQFFNLLPAMTVRENVELPLLLRGESALRASYEQVGHLHFYTQASALRLLSVCGYDVVTTRFARNRTGRVGQGRPTLRRTLATLPQAVIERVSPAAAAALLGDSLVVVAR